LPIVGAYSILPHMEDMPMDACSVKERKRIINYLRNDSDPMALGYDGWWEDSLLDAIADKIEAGAHYERHTIHAGTTD
jgi:hypothetical protein